MANDSFGVTNSHSSPLGARIKSKIFILLLSSLSPGMISMSLSFSIDQVSPYQSLD
jgi:hypothetical protein